MTLEEAIKNMEEVANENDDSAKVYYRVLKLETNSYRKHAEDAYVECKKRADEHRQIAELLKELKERREKEIPKKLIAEGDGYADGSMVYDIFYCPSCDHRIEEDEVEGYCPNCGQKIYWEGE